MLEPAKSILKSLEKQWHESHAALGKEIHGFLMSIQPSFILSNGKGIANKCAMKGIQLIHRWIQGSEHTLAKGYSLGSLSQTYDKSERLSDSSIIIWIIIDHLLYDLVCAFDIVKRSIGLKA